MTEKYKEISPDVFEYIINQCMNSEHTNDFLPPSVGDRIIIRPESKLPNAEHCTVSYVSYKNDEPCPDLGTTPAYLLGISRDRSWSIVEAIFDVETRSEGAFCMEVVL